MENFKLNYINKYTKETKRLLGIDYTHLQLLIEQGKILHKREQEKLEKKKTRLNRAGGGNNPKLSTEMQIILTLVYLRHNISFQLLGLMFEVSESTAHNIFTYWQQLFGDELPPSLLEQVKKSLKELEEVREKLTESELIVDSSEQEIERPLDYDSQKENYSGKRKCIHLNRSWLYCQKWRILSM
ncbi:transposase family protein [Synechocystis sp. B12]|nr:transposase family protein [Synechocystis sp. B12]WLT39360.1 transposase family protein [Synechocystis sp. B12]